MEIKAIFQKCTLNHFNMDVKKGEKQLCPHDHVWHGTNEFLMPALDRKAPRDEIRLFKANLPDLLLRKSSLYQSTYSFPKWASFIPCRM